MKTFNARARDGLFPVIKRKISLAIAIRFAVDDKSIRSQRLDERIWHDSVRRLVHERRTQPTRPISPT